MDAGVYHSARWPAPQHNHPFSHLRTRSRGLSDHPSSGLQPSKVSSMNWGLNGKPGRPLPLPMNSQAACADCVTECNEPTCPPGAIITSQCTDQCVVIACNDPDHGDMNCHGGRGPSHCDLVCDGAANCTDCSGFDEFLQCCTDYHSYFSEARGYTGEQPSVPFPWDPSLDALLCACSDGQGQDPLPLGAPPLTSSSGSSPSSGLETPTFLPAMLSNSVAPFGTPLPIPPFQSTQFPPQHVSQHSLSVTAPERSTLTCMWGSCQATFLSLAELVGHVNLQHLRLPASGHLPVSPPASPLIPEGDSKLSCLWGDCNVYPSPDSMPGPSSGDQIDKMLSVLASHLLHDHLGLSTTIPLADTPNQNLGIQDDLMTYSTPSESPNHAHSPQPTVHHECSGTHKCQWHSCGLTFSSCDELTTHLTAVHVGAGKAQYECFWDGCTRHGDHGFTSKQKICRHLQSHTGHRPFQCQVCHQNFSEAATLQQHMRRHTQEKPYTCDYPGCGKCFAIAGALTIHKRTHNGHKPFKCTYCDRAFAESSNLSKHLRTHTGARPYSCPEPGCAKTFARPDQLTRHLGVHRKKNVTAEG